MMGRKDPSYTLQTTNRTRPGAPKGNDGHPTDLQESQEARPFPSLCPHARPDLEPHLFRSDLVSPRRTASAPRTVVDRPLLHLLSARHQGPHQCSESPGPPHPPRRASSLDRPAPRRRPPPHPLAHSTPAHRLALRLRRRTLRPRPSRLDRKPHL